MKLRPGTFQAYFRSAREQKEFTKKKEKKKKLLFPPLCLLYSLYCTSFSQHAYLSRSNGVRRQIFARRNKSFALLLRRVKSAD